MTMKQNNDIFSISSSSRIMPPEESHPDSSSASDECEFRRNSSKPQQLVNIDSSNTMMMEQNATEIPNTKSATRRPKERRIRSIKWGVARLYPICRLEEYSQERICQTWYQPHEYAEISGENLELIDQLMVHGSCREDSTCTARGLEHMTDDEITRRKRLRDEAVDAVLDEQDRQHLEEHRITPEPDAIARVYSPIALRAYKIAQRIGLQDEQAAKEIEAESRSTIRKPLIGVKADRKVQFCTSVKVHPGLHLSEYTSKQLQQCWYMDSDIKSFKSDGKKLIKSLRKAKIVFPTVENYENMLSGSSRYESSRLPNPITVCIRGLEPYLCSSNVGTRKENVIRVWNAVLDEQDRQDDINEVLPAHLAEASRKASVYCVEMARKLGQQDEYFVATYLAKDLEQLGIRLPHQPNENSASQRPGSIPSSSMPYRAHRDYRRDSLSVAGAASKTTKQEGESSSTWTAPPSFIAIREAQFIQNELSHSVPVSSPHPLGSGSVSSHHLNGKIDRDDIGSSESSSNDFNTLKSMARAINQQALRKERFLVLDRKD